MKKKVLLALLTIVLTQSCSISLSFSQGVYLSRQGVTRLTKRIEACKLLEKRLQYSNNQVEQLRIALVAREIEFESRLSRLDSVIAIAEYDLSEMQIKYDKAISLIPKRKRKKLQ
jgi:hypothetical protein